MLVRLTGAEDGRAGVGAGDAGAAAEDGGIAGAEDGGIAGAEDGGIAGAEDGGVAAAEDGDAADVGFTGALPDGIVAPPVGPGAALEPEAVAMQVEKTWVLKVASCVAHKSKTLKLTASPNLIISWIPFEHWPLS